MEAVAAAARAIKAGEIGLAIAGGAESMTRAPLVMGKAEAAFQRSAEVFDTTIGWRFVNPRMKALYGVDSMPETAQNVADEHQVSREDQDAFALRSQQPRPRRRRRKGRSTPRSSPSRSRIARARSAASRRTSIRAPTRRSRRWRSSSGIVRPDGSVTAGNASGVNDGAAALILASRRGGRGARTSRRSPGCSATRRPASRRG